MTTLIIVAAVAPACWFIFVSATGADLFAVALLAAGGLSLTLGLLLLRRARQQQRQTHTHVNAAATSAATNIAGSGGPS